jgi:hypothetical protein
MPLIDENIKSAAREGQWFCCHVNLGTCHGAAKYGRQQERQTQRERLARTAIPSQ